MGLSEQPARAGQDGCAADEPNTLDDFIALIDAGIARGEIRLQLGLKGQGHLETVRRMLAAGASWDDIGAEIGWAGGAVESEWAARVAAGREVMGCPASAS